jgi:hypothetical protein
LKTFFTKKDWFQYGSDKTGWLRLTVIKSNDILFGKMERKPADLLMTLHAYCSLGYLLYGLPLIEPGACMGGKFYE